MVMYHPAPRVETIIYIKKENRSIVYSSPHDSRVSRTTGEISQRRKGKASHSNSKRGWGKEGVSSTGFVLIMTFKVHVRDIEAIFIAKQVVP